MKSRVPGLVDAEPKRDELEDHLISRFAVSRMNDVSSGGGVAETATA